MSDVTAPEETTNAISEKTATVLAFFAMVGMVGVWLWLFFDIVQPWLDGA